MGIFDRFRKAKQTAAPGAESGGHGASPKVPTRATIATFVIADAVGMLQLESGEQLRFGRSACKGFEPVIGASVIVEEIASDPRGWKARVVKLDSADGNYDALLSARNAREGLPDHTWSPAQAAGAAHKLGIVTVLLREPLPSGHQAMRAWVASRGFPRDGFDANLERDLQFVMPSGRVLTYPGRATLPADGLDMRNVGGEFDLGRSFIGFGLGMPGSGRKMRLIINNDRDYWAPNSSLRQLSRLVCLLADSATGVVLHRAGHLVVPIDEFVCALGDLGDPECRPFRAWLDVAITRHGGKEMYATFGMDVFGLPNVLAAVNADDRWSRSHRLEAVLYACHRMIRDNRELQAGDTLAVPVRASIGAWPLEIDERAAVTAYEVTELDGDLELEARREPPADAKTAVNLYQALFDCGLAELVPGHIVRDVRANSGQPVEHSVEVRAREDGRGFLVVSNGFGREARFEVAAWVPLETFDLVKLVGALAKFAFTAPAHWKVGDMVAAPVEELGIGGFILADGGTVAVGAAPSVQILLLIPLAETNYADVRGDGPEAWLARNPPTEAAWDAFVTAPD